MSTETLQREHRLDGSQTLDPLSRTVSRTKDTGSREQMLALMGDRRAGKSSIQGVVFHKQLPQDTLFTESAMPTQPGTQSFLKFNVTEIPEDIDYFGTESYHIFRDKGAVIWVIDAQDQYLETLNHLLDTIVYLTENFPHIYISIFVHKVDGLSEEYKEDTFRDIRQRVSDEMHDRNYDDGRLTYHLTSIYDYTIFEAVGKVIQKLLPQHPTLESLLNSLCSTCRIQKAYLFDIPSKIFIASDTSPQDSNNYFVCADLIDVVVDVGELWGWDRSKHRAYPGDDKTDYNNEGCESIVTMEHQGGRYLYLKEMNQYVALVCIMAEDNPLDRKVLIDYNVGIFKDALEKVWAV